MKIRLEAVTSIEQEAAAARVRREVFGTDWAEALCPIFPNDSSRASHLIARVLPEEKVIATVSLIDTTGNRAMHEKYGLTFHGLDRVARYTHMAVLRPYYCLKLPLYMLLEAHRLFVVPRGFEYTWLLFPARQAATSTFCRLLHFSAMSQVTEGEQGPCRVLLREEGTADASIADTNTRCYLDAVRPRKLIVIPASEPAITPESALSSSANSMFAPRRSSAALVREDEWVAH